MKEIEKAPVKNQQVLDKDFTKYHELNSNTYKPWYKIADRIINK